MSASFNGAEPRVSRRRFLGFAVAASAAASVGLLASCAAPAPSSQPTAQPTSPPAAATTAAAKPTTPAAAPATAPTTQPAAASGTLRMAWASTPKRLDPALAISGDEYMITGAVYDNLVYVDPALQPQPMLATEWKPAADGLSWTVILRKGVKFHDGKDLTARDVVYSFQRVLDPQTASPGRTAMGPIKSVEPIDDTTVRFVLSSPFADLPVALGGTFGRIVPEGRSASDLNISPLGSGPFKFKEFVPGSHVSLVRNESYWDTGKARVNEVRLVTMPESAAQLAALTGGQVDLLFEANIPDLAALEKDPNVVVMEVDSPGFQPFTMAANLAPFDKPKVRQAMKLLLDRPGMVQAVWLGKAAPSPDTPVGQVNPFFWNGPIPKQDIEAAKRMLAEAGFPNGLDLECWTSNERNGLMEAAVTVKEMAAPAGVRIEIKNVPWAQHTTDVWKKKAFYVNNWFGRATIDETLYPYFHTQGSWNDGGPYSNPELDTLLDAGRSEADPAKRKDIYGKAQQIIANDGHFVVPYHSKYVGARRKSVQGYQLHPLRWVNLRGTSVGA